MHKLLVIVLCICTISMPLFGEVAEPEDYGEDEFPQFLKDLRRLEIILLGSLPFSLFVSLETYDIYRYISYGGAPEYQPWPFRTQGVGYSREEALGVLFSALTVSLILSIADLIIGKIRNAKATPGS